jgi:hypothetical protein
MGKLSTKITIIDKKNNEIVLKEDKKNNLSIFILEHIYKIYSEEKNHEFIN